MRAGARDARFACGGASILLKTAYVSANSDAAASPRDLNRPERCVQTAGSRQSQVRVSPKTLKKSSRVWVEAVCVSVDQGVESTGISKPPPAAESRRVPRRLRGSRRDAKETQSQELACLETAASRLVANWLMTCAAVALTISTSLPN